YALRNFTTGSISTVFPLEGDDVADSPAPAWVDTTGVAVVLPGAPPQPGILSLESPLGASLLMISGAGGQNQINNPPSLPSHVPLRIRIDAGGQSLTLPETNLSFTDGEGVDRIVLLPSIVLSAAQSAYFWIASNGS